MTNEGRKANTGDANHPPLDWLWRLPRARPESIARIENLRGVRLPVSYVHCALENHGAVPSRRLLITPTGEPVEFHSLLPLESSTGQRDASPDCGPTVEETIGHLGARLPASLVPFARDPGGNLFCFSFEQSGATPSIVLWSLEEGLGGEPVARDFDELLGLLESDEPV